MGHRIEHGQQLSDLKRHFHRKDALLAGLHREESKRKKAREELDKLDAARKPGAPARPLSEDPERRRWNEAYDRADERIQKYSAELAALNLHTPFTASE